MAIESNEQAQPIVLRRVTITLHSIKSWSRRLALLLLSMLLSSDAGHGAEHDTRPVIAINTASNIPLLAVSESSDSLTETYRNYVTWCDSLSKRTMEFFARALVLLVLPAVLCGFAFLRLRFRTLAVQWVLFTLATLIAFECPIHRIDFGSPGRAWFLAFVFLAILILPWILAFLITRTLPWRRGIAFGLYVLLFVAFLTNLFTR